MLPAAPPPSSQPSPGEMLRAAACSESGQPPQPHRRRRWPGWLGALGGLLLLWGGGLGWFILSATGGDHPPQDGVTADVAVVLTGGSERLMAGVTLLQQGLARQLFVSGVHPATDLEDLLRPLHLKPTDLPAGAVQIGHQAHNTRGNAEETAAWVRAQGARSLRLVTADYHMRRAMVEFRRLLPDVLLLPHPVHPQFPSSLPGWRPWSPRLARFVIEYNKFMLAWLRAQTAF